MIFAYVAYKTSQVELDFTEFDPYSELGIDRVCSWLKAYIRQLAHNIQYI